jgi:hypothetical protein
LAVWVIATLEGLAITASDGRGHTFERVAPDVETAAALIASWAAEDTLPQVTMPELGSHADQIVVRATPPEPHLHAAFAGAMIGRELGARVETELYVRGPWRIGVAASGTAGTLLTYTAEQDVRAFETFGVTTSLGGFGVRAALGIGLQITSLRLANMPGGEGQTIASGRNTLLATEASVLVRRALTDRWAVAVGATANVLPSSRVSIQAMSVTEDLGHVAVFGLAGAEYLW